MDVLSDVLAVMRTGRPVSALVRWHAPWAQEFAAVPGAAGFHVNLRGPCWLVMPDAPPISLAAGDIVFRPHGRGHVLAGDVSTRPTGPACRPDSPRVPPPETDGTATVTLCGAYELDPALIHPLLHDLPEVVHVSAGRPDLRAAVDLLAAELESPGLGTDALIPALLDTLLTLTLRDWLTGQQTARTPWAAALNDPAVAAALAAIHSDPARPWTIAALGAEAGLSRSPFARRFTTVLGRPPLSYLTWWRMTIAARFLRQTDDPVSAVAHRVGYASEFAFAAAFKRHHGLAPGRYRRRA